MTQQNSFTNTLAVWVGILSSATALVVTTFTAISSLRVEIALQRQQIDLIQERTKALETDVRRIDRNVLVLEKAIEEENPNVAIRNENSQP